MNRSYLVHHICPSTGQVYVPPLNVLSLCQQVTNTGKEVICENCITGSPSGKTQAAAAVHERSLHSLAAAREATSSPTRATAHQHNQNGTGLRNTDTDGDGTYDPNGCAGCNEQLKEGQALIALDRQWHISCFRYNIN